MIDFTHFTLEEFTACNGFPVKGYIKRTDTEVIQSGHLRQEKNFDIFKVEFGICKSSERFSIERAVPKSGLLIKQVHQRTHFTYEDDTIAFLTILENSAYDPHSDCGRRIHYLTQESKNVYYVNWKDLTWQSAILSMYFLLSKQRKCTVSSGYGYNVTWEIAE